MVKPGVEFAVTESKGRKIFFFIQTWLWEKKLGMGIKGREGLGAVIVTKERERETLASPPV